MMDKGYRELCIDAEFKALIRPLRRDEYAQLEANLVLDGCRDPIIPCACARGRGREI